MSGKKQDKISPIIKSTTVGESLRQARLKQRLSIAQASKATCIREGVIEQLEEGNFADFPAQVQLQGLLKNYANFLGLDTEAVLARYRRESTNPKPQKKEEEKKTKEKKQFQLYTKRNLTIISIFLACVLCLFYLGGQINNLLTPPSLKLTAPVELTADFNGDIFVAGNSFKLQGVAAPKSVVRFNSDILEQDIDGSFSTNEIPLRTAELKVIITATNQLGKTSTISLVIKRGNTGIATVDKMSVLIEIQNEVTPLLVRADGKIEFDDRAFPGDIITLDAEQRLQIESSTPQNILLKINGKDYQVTGVNKSWELVGGEVVAN